MQKILVIGCGELGSRHVQSLYKNSHLNSKREIHIVDNSNSSISITKERLNQITTSLETNLNFAKTIDELKNKDFDFVVISTSATNRLEIFKEIVLKLNFKNILLEKVLFQNSTELAEAKKIISKNQINAFVNCPRRNFGHYLEIREIISAQSNVNISVKGVNWGMACNSIHFIDLWFFLANPLIYNIDVEGVHSEVFNSKRESFKEIFGNIKLVGNNTTLTLDCYPGEIGSLTVQIDAGDMLFIIDEINSKIITCKNGEEFESDIIFSSKYQSEMTGHICDDIISSVDCGLTPFDESYNIHYEFLNTMLGFFKRNLNNELDKCPIT